MQSRLGGRALALAVVSMMLVSGLMVLPSNASAKHGTPDLVVRSIGWRFPLVDGEDLLATVYVENIGDASVQTGFWLGVNYAEQAGFWQEATETHQIWVEPPIKPGEIKAIGFTTTALSTHQANLEAIIDTTNVIQESNKANNIGHVCHVYVGSAPGSPISVPLYVRNANLLFAESFTIEIDKTTVPEGWGISGGIPPTTVTVTPGSNAILSESATVPIDTTLNPFIRINATRQSDGASQSIYFKVITTPEIGFSFNPYLNKFSVCSVDEIESEMSISSELISQRGAVTLTKHTVTNARGQYISAIVSMINTKQLNMFKITQIDYNGVETIVPEENYFITSYKVKDDKLQHYFQEMRYDDTTTSSTCYDPSTGTTTFTSHVNGDRLIANFDTWEGLGLRISNGKIIPIRLDTSDPSQPLCDNFTCWINVPCAA